MALYDKPNFNFALRIKIAVATTTVLFSILIIRLWYLQIVRGDYFRNLSENNRIRSVYVQAPRGIIYDRNGVLLAGNRPSFSIELVTEDCPDEKGVIAKLESILDLPKGSIAPDNVHSRRRRPFEPKLLLRDVSRDVVAKVAAHKFDLPGVTIEAIPTRDYIKKDSLAHVIGYIREISKDQLNDERYRSLQSGDIIGQFGLEAMQDEMLRGVRGLQRVEVNAMGTRMSEYSFESERMGNDIHLTIDADMQMAAEEALKGKKGAVVAMDPWTGEILALVSEPAFDPNIFTGEVTPDVWKDIATGKPSKLSNRALQSVYPPGSVFKIVTGMAALSEKIMSPQEKVFCPGYLSFGGRRFRCHKASGHGWVNFESALIQSCDVYFYTIGSRINIDTINKYGLLLGLGEPTGFPLAQEARGLIPSTEWKKNYFRKPEDKIWYPGETLSVAIGQGAVLVTPIQVARLLSVIANGGKIFKPQIVKEIRGGDNNLLKGFEPVLVSESQLNSAALKYVREALTGVVNDPHGTGGRAKLEKFPEILVAGKTGTAQVVSLEFHGKKEEFGDHAWFASYAPANKPELVVVAIVENGGHGGAAAAPITKAVYEAYFSKKLGKEHVH